MGGQGDARAPGLRQQLLQPVLAGAVFGGTLRASDQQHGAGQGGGIPRIHRQVGLADLRQQRRGVVPHHVLEPADHPAPGVGAVHRVDELLDRAFGVAVPQPPDGVGVEDRRLGLVRVAESGVGQRQRAAQLRRLERQGQRHLGAPRMAHHVRAAVRAQRTQQLRQVAGVAPDGVLRLRVGLGLGPAAAQAGGDDAARFGEGRDLPAPVAVVAQRAVDQQDRRARARIHRMNEIAEKGLAAHWKYKEGNAQAQESKLDSWLQHLRDILTNPDTDTLDFLQDFKLDLFTEEIYIYTPKGDMRVLPKGATALDFAFDIHSELGARCIGAKVNYRLVPISHQLKSGDQVEIITSSKQKPSEDWLGFVTTAKAKSRIKYYLKEEKRKIGDDGKAVLQRKLDHMNVPLSQHNVNELCVYFKKPSPLDLFYAVAVGSLDLKELKNFSVHGDKLHQPAKEIKLESRSLISEDEVKHHKPAKGAELIIFGESSDRIKYKLAQCCQPIPGDDVFGFITSGEGLKIHRTDCPNAAQLLANYGHRVVKTKWAKNKEISFLSGVRLTGLDDVGVIQKITNVISGELNMNMRSISIDSRDGTFEGNIMVFVHDREELDALCQALGNLQGITKVERLEAQQE